MKRSITQNISALPRLMTCILFLPCFLLMEKNLSLSIYIIAGLFFIYALILYAAPRSSQYLNLVFPFSLLIEILFLTAFLFLLDRYIHVLATFYLLPIIGSAFEQKRGMPYLAAALSAILYIILAIIQGYWLVPIILQIISFFVIAYCTATMTRQFHQAYSFQANQDSMTRVSNRRYFDYYLQKLIASQTPHSLILLDVDNFKQLNDSQGHQHGDYVLKVIALTLKENTHTGSDLAARFGGDEFALILPYTSKEDSKKVAEKIRTSILINPKLLPYPNVSVSLGIAGYPEDAESLDDLLANVDTALYEAKERGKNNVYVFND